MDPSTLKTLLLLKVNKDLWNEEIIQEILGKEAAIRRTITSSSTGTSASIDNDFDSDDEY